MDREKRACICSTVGNGHSLSLSQEGGRGEGILPLSNDVRCRHEA